MTLALHRPYTLAIGPGQTAAQRKPLGFDRLVVLCTGARRIEDVL